LRGIELKKSDRYDVSHLVEAQFEPSSHRRVLKNLLEIKSKREMDRVEAREQYRTLEELIGILVYMTRITVLLRLIFAGFIGSG
jgi:hypothetical protein